MKSSVFNYFWSACARQVAPLLRPMGVLVTGSLMGRIAGATTLPFLAHIYGPEEFGVFSIFMSCLVISTPLISLRLALAIPSLKHEGHKLTFMAGALSISGCMSLMLVAIVLMLSAFGLLDSTWPYLICLAIMGAFFVALFEMFLFWHTSFQNFSHVAKLQVVRILLGEVFKVALGLLSVISFGLILGHLVGYVVIGSLAISYFGHKLLLSSYGRMRAAVLLMRFRGIALYRVPSQLLLQASSQLLILISSSRFELHVVGLIGMAYSLNGALATLVGSAASHVYFGRSAAGQGISVGAKQNPRVTCLWLCVLVSIFGVLISCFLWAFAESIVERFFEFNWVQLPVYLQIVSLALPLQMAVHVATNYMTSIDKNRELLLINMCRAVFVIVFFALSSLRSDLTALDLVLYYTTFMGMIYLMTLLIIFSFRPRQSRLPSLSR